METTVSSSRTPEISDPPIDDPDACRDWFRGNIGEGYLKSFDVPGSSRQDRTSCSVRQAIIYCGDLQAFKFPPLEIKERLKQFVRACQQKD